MIRFTTLHRLTLRALFLAIGLLGLVQVGQASHGVAGDITYRQKPGIGNERIFIVTFTLYQDRAAGGINRPWINVSGESFVELWTYQNGVALVKQVTFNPGRIPRINGPLVDFNDGGTIVQVHDGEVVRAVSPGSDSLDLYRCVYQIEVDIPPGSMYVMRYAESVRQAGIDNLGGGSSDSYNFYIETVFDLQLNSFNRNSIVFNNEPIDYGCIGEIWSHNPAATDADGDRLVFSFVDVRNYTEGQTNPTPVPPYTLPNLCCGNDGSSFTINRNTGLITWDAPRAKGVYNIAFRVEEFDDAGIKVGEVVRDMQIRILDCRNDPPVIEAPEFLCAQPDTLLQIPINVYDEDAGDSLYLFFPNVNQAAFPYAVRYAATFTPAFAPTLPFNPASVFATITRLPTIQGRMNAEEPRSPTNYGITTTFRWDVDCEDIRSSPYRLDFKAEDNQNRIDPTSGVSVPLVDNHILEIKVIGPAPRNLFAAPGGGAGKTVDLLWQPPANCASDSFLIGYEVWRAPDSLGVASDNCCTGGAGPGYVLIATILQTQGPGGPLDILPPDSNYTDDLSALPFVGRYCYRIIPLFNGRSAGDRGCPSEEACVRFAADAPVLLNVDVTATSNTAGSVRLRWRTPNFLPTSYVGREADLEYRVFQAAQPAGTGALTFTQLFTSPYNDTTETIPNLNTQDNRYTYRVDLFDRTTPAGGTALISSATASSIYLNVTSQNEALTVRWNLNTPWVNRDYEIYRSTTGINGTYTYLRTLDPPGGTAGTEASFSITDAGLTTGQTYCYYIRGRGSYENPLIHSDTLINFSQRRCGTPQDTIPPCQPTATFTCTPEFDLLFTIDEPEACGDDIQYYIVFLRAAPGAGLDSIGTVTPAVSGPTPYPYTPANGLKSGCITFVPVDFSGNKGEGSAETCISDECSFLQLPNVFTPNGDGVNEIFRPLQYEDANTGINYAIVGVSLVECYIYDRAGKLLNTSRDITRLWDGKVNGGSDAAAGTYFYSIRIVFDSVESPQVVERAGTITLLR